jgi:hypothetical protein
VQQGRKPFIRQRQLELCAAAAYGLAATGELEHVELLKKEATRRLTNRLIRNACRQALIRLKETRQRRRVKGSSTKSRPVGAAGSQERRELEQATTQPAQARPETASQELHVEAGGLGPASIESDAAASALPPLVPPEPPPTIAAGGEEDGIDLPDPGPPDGSKTSQEIDALLHTFLEDGPSTALTDVREEREGRERRPPTQRAVDVVKEQDAMDDMIRGFVEEGEDQARSEPDPKTEGSRPARHERPDDEGEVDELLRGYLESVD